MFKTFTIIDVTRVGHRRIRGGVPDGRRGPGELVLPVDPPGRTKVYVTTTTVTMMTKAWARLGEVDGAGMAVHRGRLPVLCNGLCIALTD